MHLTSHALACSAIDRAPNQAIAAEEKSRSAQFEARCRSANEKVLSFTEQVDMLKEHLEDSVR